MPTPPRQPLHPGPHMRSGAGQGREGRLTIPFCTLKPSWYLRSGRLMRTVVTGGQLTMLSFTCVWFFRPCRTGQASQGASMPPMGTLSVAQTEAESASRVGALGAGERVWWVSHLSASTFLHATRVQGCWLPQVAVRAI